MFTRLTCVIAAAAPLAAGAVCNAAAVVFPINLGGNGNTYEVVVDPSATIDVARAGASALGGHLVTITSAAEQSFVEALLESSGAPTGSYWMDLQRSDTSFVWGTGEAFGYSNFADGEPNAFLGKENVGQVYWAQDLEDDLVSRRGQWNDSTPSGYPNADNPSFPTPDLSRAGFIVEREAAPAAVPLPLAVIAAPLTALLAAGAARRMRRSK